MSKEKMPGPGAMIWFFPAAEQSTGE